jgi:hypothetical protein
MPAARQPGSASSPRPRTSSRGPLLLVGLALAVGAGGIAFLFYQHKKEQNQPVEAEVSEEEASVTIVSKSRKPVKKEDPLAAIEAALPELLQQAKFKDALALLDQVEPVRLNKKAREAVKTYQEQVNKQAEERLKSDWEKVESLVASKDYDGALNVLVKIQEYGLGSAPEEARKRASEVEPLKGSHELLARIQACANISSALSPVLKELDYTAAVSVIDEQAQVPENQVFAEELAAVKQDIKAVEALWAEFLKVMGGKAGTEESFGARQGKIAGVRDGKLVLGVNGAEESLGLKDFRPKWIEDRLGLSAGDSDPEKRYAAGVLCWHRGLAQEARDIFEKLPGHPGAERQLQWIGWEREVAAKAILDELKESGKEDNPENIRKLAARLRTDYGETRMVKLEDSVLRDTAERADGAIGEMDKKIKDRLDLAETAAAQERAGIENWFEIMKEQAMALHQKEMLDDTTYHKVVHKLKPGERPPWNVVWVGTTKDGMVGYYEQSNKIDKRENLKRIRELLDVMKPTTANEISFQDKFKEEEDRLVREIKMFNDRHQERASKLKALHTRKLVDLKNNKLRMIRRIKSGDEVTEEEIDKALATKKGEELDEKDLEKALEKAAEKGPEKGAEKGPAKGAAKSSKKASEKH